MNKSLNILIVEDWPADAELLVAELCRAGFIPNWKRVETEADFLAELVKAPDIILSDYSLPRFSGLEALELLNRSGWNIPFILISGTVGEDVAVEAMKRGASDYLLKDRIARLGSVVERALDQQRLRAERQRVEASLNLFRALIDRSNEGFEVIDPETGRFLDVNETACQRLGYQREEMLAMSVPDVETLAVDAQSWAHIVEQIRQADSKILEGRHRRRDGSTFPVEVSVRYVKLDRDYLIAAVRDITDRKRTEEVLRASEERLRLVTDNAKVGLVMVNRDHCYTFANATYAEILGLPSAEIIGKRVPEVLPGLYATQIRPRLELAFTGERVAFELHLNQAEALRYFAVRYEPMKLGETVSQVVVVITDITERKQAEEARQASEGRYRVLFEYAPDGILIADLEGKYLDTNASLCRMLGYAREELIGMHASAIVAQHEVPHIQPALETIKAKEEYHREWQFRRKDGSLFTAEVIATLMPDGNVLGMIRDVTERRRAQEEIQNQLSELQRWHEAMLGREDRILELKREVNALLAAQHLPNRYACPATP